MEFIDCERIVFQGVARVSLQSISFSLGGIDENQVLRLTNTFLAERCLRHKEMNHIIALVVHKANINRGTLSLTKTNNEEHPMLKFPVDYTLCGLRGRHRIFTGREILVENERWREPVNPVFAKIPCTLKSHVSLNPLSTKISCSPKSLVRQDPMYP